MLRRLSRHELSEAWLLVSQIDHARLAGGLAEVWVDDGMRHIEPQAEFIAAVFHHDDGWAEWDAAPDVDRTLGRPLSFVEMPLETSIEIWSKSIQSAATFGPLAAHVVSGHFTALLQQAAPRWSLDPRRFQTSREFLNEQSERREVWLAQWQREDPPRRTRKMAEQALAYLQFFDALSLWLCAAERHDAQLFTAGAGPEVLFAPQGGERFTANPWPLMVPEWHWTVRARRVPVGRYASRETLAATPGESVELRFKLQRLQH